MKNIWLILKTEFINTITRRSFLLILILVPLVPALILGGVSLFGGDNTGEDVENIFQPSQQEKTSEGYVDQADIIHSLPEWIGQDRLIPYDGEDDARSAVVNGDINGYYLIPSDYIQSGDVRYVREDFNPLGAIEETYIITSVIEYNLLGGDPQRHQAFVNPAQVQQIDLSPDDNERDESSPLAFYLPYGVTLLFYILILTSASLMLNSVAKEKENRVMEILMSSVKPKQLMAGKILGLGLVGLLQMILWMGSGILLLRLGGTTLNIPPSLQLPPEIFYWGIPFFILGYLIYATIMAGVGALVPNLKEGTQATFYVILPILVPLLLIGVIIDQPNATLPVILSLIPFTAPNTIMTRMAVSPVPLWQLLIALGLMILTVVFLIRAVSGMFRANLLLTGKKFSLKAYMMALHGKEHTPGSTPTG
jgi:ABC-2 type transport system permease protein